MSQGLESLADEWAGARFELTELGNGKIPHS
jgi:hypothetical protein